MEEEFDLYSKKIGFYVGIEQYGSKRLSCLNNISILKNTIDFKQCMESLGFERDPKNENILLDSLAKKKMIEFKIEELKKRFQSHNLNEKTNSESMFLFYFSGKGFFLLFILFFF